MIFNYFQYSLFFKTFNNNLNVLQKHMSETKIYDELDKSRQDLERFAKESDDSCTKYVFEILVDKRVQESFVNHIVNGEDFVGFSCHGFGRDSTEIVFRFQCRAPRICIIAPAFAVQYDPMTKSIIQIIDPYLGKNLMTKNS
jgi:hypothetical protein